MVEMENRRKYILEVVISSYIDTAEPVGSSTLQRRFNINLSSATIRNVLADLEREGYVTQPHTSAGRIPTDKGYRYYVDSLMRSEELSLEEKNFIDQEYNFNKSQIEEIIEKTSHVLSSITEQAGVVLFPSFHQSHFERLEIVSLGPRNVLVILVTDTGMIRNEVVKLKEEISQDELNKIVRFLNDELYHMPLSEIRPHLLKKVKQDTSSFFYISRRAAEIIRQAIARSHPLRISMEGTSYILEKPEFQDISRTKLLVRLLDNKPEILNLLRKDMAEQEMKVYIGRENQCESMDECTFISQGYCVGKKVVGRLGIIGPRRMKYAKMMAIVDYVSNVVSRHLERLSR